MSFDSEWLEADGRGGYAMSTAGLVPTRRYHGYVVHARKPPVDRVVLVNDVDVVLERGDDRFERTEILEFFADPVPTWALRFADGSIVEQQFRLCRKPVVSVLRWRRLSGDPAAVLRVRPLFTCRDFHALHFQNDHFRFKPVQARSAVTWRPYRGIPSITAVSTGSYHHDPQWRTGIHYPEEQARGFDCHEDYASPGSFLLGLNAPAILAFAVGDTKSWRAPGAVGRVQRAVRQSDARRKRLGSPLDRSADAYFVTRGKSGRSIIAGYPWFNDWGRDTMIAVRGLGIARGRRKYVREILQTWGGTIDQGMLPNCFIDRGAPRYNAMDAPLWFVVAAFEFLRAVTGEFPAKLPGKKKIVAAILAVLEHFRRGTRHGIHPDRDGLLTGGDPGTNLTWMDARVGGVPVTPRNGKPVEINALWINALWIGSHVDRRWRPLFEAALASFQSRFWLDDGYLADVVDSEPHAVDQSFRPNQIFAVGGLPLVLLPRGRARAVVDAVERILYTPLGLRTLDPADPRYRGRYEGTPYERDSSYHQGTAWPWLLGPFVEGWLRARAFSDEAVEEAEHRFIGPWAAATGQAGLGHVCEIADGDAPHTPRGCPFQAWSVSELLRIRALLNGAPAPHTHGIWTAENAR